MTYHGRDDMGIPGHLNFIYDRQEALAAELYASLPAVAAMSSPRLILPGRFVLLSSLLIPQ